MEVAYGEGIEEKCTDFCSSHIDCIYYRIYRSVWSGVVFIFCKFTTVNNAEWVRLTNYKAALTDASFGRSFVFTVLFAVVSILTINVIAFGLAVLLTQKIKGTNIFRTVFFMPNLIGGIVLGYIWQILINCVLTLVENRF